MIMRYGFHVGRENVWLLYVLILIGGFYWCREIFYRWPEDIATFRQGIDRSEKLVTLVYWGVTAGIMALMAYSAWALAMKIVEFVK